MIFCFEGFSGTVVWNALSLETCTNSQISKFTNLNKHVGWLYICFLVHSCLSSTYSTGVRMSDGFREKSRIITTLLKQTPHSNRSTVFTMCAHVQTQVWLLVNARVWVVIDMCVRASVPDCQRAPHIWLSVGASSSCQCNQIIRLTAVQWEKAHSCLKSHFPLHTIHSVVGGGLSYGSAGRSVNGPQVNMCAIRTIWGFQ